MNSIVLGSNARRRRLYLAAAVFSAVVILVGFAPSYYLKTLFGTPELSTLKHFHGLVFSSWIVLFVIQTWLVSSDRRDLHRRLGVAGALLVAVMSVAGYLLAVDSARRGFTPNSQIGPLSFMAIPLFDLGVFVALVVWALLLRRRSDWHKRLMLLATLSLLPPALARIAMQFPPAPVMPIALGASALIVIAAAGIDAFAQRRLHPAMLWGATLFLISLPIRILIARTHTWQAFAAWLIS